MNARQSFFAVAVLGSLPLVFAGGASAEGTPGDCASVSAHASYRGSGYAHLVTLTNHCQSAVTCEVWTNVDPSPRVSLHAKPGETVETVTRIGSPSSEVQAGKQCRFGA